TPKNARAAFFTDCLCRLMAVWEERNEEICGSKGCGFRLSYLEEDTEERYAGNKRGGGNHQFRGGAGEKQAL
ncbi:MAG: hypothetical protein K2I96_22820, partial [Lachnospiraceae bacterium]|nr:hypothetical protein [Lachnospiraceae bacterium]